MKLNKTLLKIAGQRIVALLTNDTIYCVIGTILGLICAFVHYFGDGDIQKAIFWMLCALVCIMNLKETPK